MCTRNKNKTWYADFIRGRKDTDDAERSGRPNEAVKPENIEKIHKIVLNDRIVKFHELADIVKISKERVGFILHDHLSTIKLCSKWEQKQQRVDDFKQWQNYMN